MFWLEYPYQVPWLYVVDDRELMFVVLAHARMDVAPMDAIGREGSHVAAPLLDLFGRGPPVPHRHRHGQEGPRARRLRPRPP